MDEDEAEIEVEEFVLPPHKLSGWVFLGAVFEMIEGLLVTYARFWGALSLMSLSHFKHVEDRKVMHDQATAEIETLIGE